MLIIKKSLPILSIAYLTSLYALPQSIAAIPKFKSSAGSNFVHLLFILIVHLDFRFERDIQHCTFLKIVKNIKKLSKLKISRC